MIRIMMKMITKITLMISTCNTSTYNNDNTTIDIDHDDNYNNDADNNNDDNGDTTINNDYNHHHNDGQLKMMTAW